jgi:hypothetical protein
MSAIISSSPPSLGWPGGPGSRPVRHPRAGHCGAVTRASAGPGVASGQDVLGYIPFPSTPLQESALLCAFLNLRSAPGSMGSAI